MSQHHTPEPLRIGTQPPPQWRANNRRRKRFDGGSSNNRKISFISSQHQPHCCLVKACRGLDTSDLETNGVVHTMGNLLISLERQRDELLAALEELRLYVAYNGDDWVQRKARAAIASGKGGAEPTKTKSCGTCRHDHDCAESCRHKECLIGNELSGSRRF